MAFHRINFEFTVSVVLTSAACRLLPRRWSSSPRRRCEKILSLRAFLKQSVAAAKRRSANCTHVSKSGIERSHLDVRRIYRNGGKIDDGFHGEFALSQLFKFPGKRALEIAIAQRNVRACRARAGRFSISTRGEGAARVLRNARGGKDYCKCETSRSNQRRLSQSPRRSARRAGYAADFETVKSQADLISANKALRQARGCSHQPRV